MDIEKLKRLLDSDFILYKLRNHAKASEKYIDLRIQQEEGFIWEGSIPYVYRRTGLDIETEEDFAKYLEGIKKYFTKTNIMEFIKSEGERWNNEMSGKEITKGFFYKLLNMKWNSIKIDLPRNSNSARRIQDIKEFGYTLSTNTKMTIKGKNSGGTYIMLLPIPKGGITGYEVINPKFKEKVIKILEEINVYELSPRHKTGLIPDHKFPEIRWDKDSKEENNSLSDDKIKNKFQLIDNQRNQQKREVCRKCFQTGKRGKIYGIDFFYEGNEDWPVEIPKAGKEAEKGCIGCGWYDINEWRKKINNVIKGLK